MEPFLEIEDVLDDLRRVAMDGNTYYEHVLKGTTEQYYSNVLTKVVNSMTILPIERGFAGLEPLDDGAEVQEAFIQMVSVIADLFGKQRRSVEEDLIRIMHTFPVEDVRSAQHLRHNNRLN
jgi:hypothetical protein